MARIVQVANFYGPRSGGIRTMMQQLGAGYLAAGHDSVLVVPGDCDSEVQLPAGRVITVSAAAVPASGGYRVITDVDRVCTVLDELAPDRLEVSDRTSLRSLGWWARARGIPSVMWSHERVDGVLRSFLPGPWPVRAMADGWNRSTARRFDTIACSTLFAREEFDRIGWSRVAHVPLGVDLATFHPMRFSAERRAELLGDDDLLLVMCSRLSKEKRPEIAIETLRELISRNVRARLVVLGSGPMQKRMTELSDALPVTMLGHVSTREDVATLLASADVCLAPGPIETFGLAALEALACGTPVVASASSALREIVEGQAGYAVATDPKQFADAALALAGRPEASRRRAARERAEHFPWSATVERMLAVHNLDSLSTPTLDPTGAL